mmetsp:Transcript_4152/g.6950  ORF Transcript_4152/g.6950 Transcript_4152/m.6950 type:complete len:559 (-) Transcript_4152:1613-3289(-)
MVGTLQHHQQANHLLVVSTRRVDVRQREVVLGTVVDGRNGCFGGFALGVAEVLKLRREERNNLVKLLQRAIQLHQQVLRGIQSGVGRAGNQGFHRTSAVLLQNRQGALDFASVGHSHAQHRHTRQNNLVVFGEVSLHHRVQLAHNLQRQRRPLRVERHRGEVDQQQQCLGLLYFQEVFVQDVRDGRLHLVDAALGYHRHDLLHLGDNQVLCVGVGRSLLLELSLKWGQDLCALLLSCRSSGGSRGRRTRGSCGSRGSSRFGAHIGTTSSARHRTICGDGVDDRLDLSCLGGATSVGEHPRLALQQCLYQIVVLAVDLDRAGERHVRVANGVVPVAHQRVQVTRHADVLLHGRRSGTQHGRGVLHRGNRDADGLSRVAQLGHHNREVHAGLDRLDMLSPHTSFLQLAEFLEQSECLGFLAEPLLAGSNVLQSDETQRMGLFVDAHLQRHALLEDFVCLLPALLENVHAADGLQRQQRARVLVSIRLRAEGQRILVHRHGFLQVTRGLEDLAQVELRGRGEQVGLAETGLHQRQCLFVHVLSLLVALHGDVHRCDVVGHP